ncbi:MAG: cell division protein FtsL [Thiothrix sp.]|nr:MAG: cell division protein FtsL [Thiothrix sp.]
MNLHRWQSLATVMLYLLVIVLALMVVANRHHARQLFVELQQLQKDRDQLSATWSRLVLEQSTQLNQVYVEKHARDVLGMQKPSPENTRVIHE